MRVLLLGATGNLGLRLVPALVAYEHEVVAYVRSPAKLHSSLSTALLNKITIHEGDASNSAAVEVALIEHNCEAIMHTARSYSHSSKRKPSSHDDLAAAVSSAAVRVGRQRRSVGGSVRPLRAWFVSGLSLMEYPGTGGWKIEDYFPSSLVAHHHSTGQVIKSILTEELRWSILCVAFMVPAIASSSKGNDEGEREVFDLLPAPSGNELPVSTVLPPKWKDHWLRSIPFIGVYLNLVPNIKSYETRLEDVADLLAHDLVDDGTNKTWLVGSLVGMKGAERPKSI